MRNLKLTILIAALSISLNHSYAAKSTSKGKASTAKETYSIDNSHTTAMFKLRHAGVSNFYGFFRKVEGAFVLDGKKSSVNVTIPVSSIFTADKKRDKHLKGPDFFNYKKYPNITFKSTKFDDKGSYANITGKLSMHGVEKTVSFKMKRTGKGPGPFGKYRIGYEGELTIKRTDYGINYGLKAIGDETTIILSVEAIREKK